MLKIRGELRRTIKWLFVGALVAQLVIIPWKGIFYVGGEEELKTVSNYGTIFVRPVTWNPIKGGEAGRWRIDHERLLVQLAVTAAALLLWLAVSKAKE